MTNENKKFYKSNSFLLVMLALLIVLATVGYSALTTNLMISGEANLRVPADIRITNIIHKGNTNGGVETYPAEYYKDGVKVFANLPNLNSTVTYEIEVTNTSDLPYTLREINEITSSNTNMTYDMDIELYDKVLGEEVVKIILTIKYKDDVTVLPDNTDCAFEIRYRFELSDEKKPILTLSKYDGIIGPKEPNLTITIIDTESGVSEDNRFTYYLSDSEEELINGSWIEYPNGEEFKVEENNGKKYLWIYPIKDNEGNINGENIDIDTPYVVGNYIVDYELPYCTINNVVESSNGVTYDWKCYDLLSGLETESEGTVTDTTTDQELTATDKAGNEYTETVKVILDSETNNYIIDETENDLIAPQANVIVTSSETEMLKATGQITVTDTGSGLALDNNYQYYVSTSDSSLIGGSWNTYENGVSFDIQTNSETSYLWIYPIKDNAGNMTGPQEGIDKPYVVKTITTENISEYTYSGNYEEFIAPKTGYYKVEAWGAQGGTYSTYIGGKGGYTKGYIYLEKDEKIYVYVGEQGKTLASGSVYYASGGYNGGGTGGNHYSYYSYGGGGATDIRYFDNYTPTASELLWNSTLGLNSRIMVAAGGAGSQSTMLTISGYGGGLVGGVGAAPSGQYAEDAYLNTGATQTIGGVNSLYSSRNGLFGMAPQSTAEGHGGGGGGGFYGGAQGYGTGGSGGSSYISGYLGSVAITSSTNRTPKSGCTDGTTDIECSYHYSGKIFEETVMIAGNAEMPSIDGNTETGHSGNGHVKIEYEGNILEVKVETEERIRSTDVIINTISSTGLSETNKYQYYVSTSNTELENGEWLNYTPGETFTINQSAGRYYLWIYPISDVEGKISDDKQDINTPYVKKEIVIRNVLSYEYSGQEEVVTISKTGYYKLETWGASGGYATSNTYAGGYGGYSTGLIYLEKDEVLYINVGGQGTNSTPGTITTYKGGYNGGGNGYVHRTEKGSSGSGGGGATHIATESGILSELSTYESVCRNQSSTCPILIVSGGGGGAYRDTDSNGYAGIGGSGGGFEGTSAKQTGSCTYDCTRYSYPSGGTQVAGGLGVTLYSTGATSETEYAGAFGQGATGTSTYGGGGGGFYGGGSGHYVAGGGGSGYIGNPQLEEKYMYCYNCTTSDEISTKTYTTANVSDTAVSEYAKSGNGYAKIEYIESMIKVDVEAIEDFESAYLTINVKSSKELLAENKYQYYISTSNTELENGEWLNYTSGETITFTENAGRYYLWIYPISDIEGNIADDKQNINTPYVKQEFVIMEAFSSYEYSNQEEMFIVPQSGYYKLETWGASGGYATSDTYAGGYGGYSTGVIYLEKDEILYINVGGQGANSTSGTNATYNGGYNGGGNGYAKGSGGGATHIATESGILSELSTYASDCQNLSSTCPILIVSGGGGGAYKDSDSNGYAGIGGSGGGFEGTSAKQTGSCTNYCTSYSYPSGGTQIAGGLGVTAWNTGATSTTQYVGTFGQGATGVNSYGGGGGGFYGGGSGQHVAGGGGSGYIGNPQLEEKYMYCYNCTTSDEISTKTYTTENVSDVAISDYAKSGDGYAKIEYIRSMLKVEVETEEKFGSTDVTINIKSSADLSLENKYQYYVSTSNTELENGEWLNYIPGETFTVEKDAGRYYLWVYPVSDVKGKISDDKLDINTPYVKQEFAIIENFSYEYSNQEEEFIVPQSGYYKLETWGAQGGSYDETYHGGYGAYASGTIYLEKDDVLYINVGGKGIDANLSTDTKLGGYNGGGNGIGSTSIYTTSGGGATHIATVSGLLSTLSSNKDSILVVAGGGGGAGYKANSDSGAGGSGGEFFGLRGGGGNGGAGGTQTAGGSGKIPGSFGQGGNIASYNGNGGGGGYYGGEAAYYDYGAGGGSSYVGNSLLVKRKMYGYSEENGYTNVSEIAVEDYSKKGDGYVRITYLEEVENLNEFEYPGEYTYEIPETGYYRLETWGAQGGSYDETYQGGYGGYSVGKVYLTEGTKLYINVGGEGKKSQKYGYTLLGGYNGGGNAIGATDRYAGSGGGATHIATTSGLLSTLSSSTGNILIVSGGGGGSGYVSSTSYVGGGSGGSGGGIQGVSVSDGGGSGGTQSAGGASGGTPSQPGTFGKGGSIASYSGNGGGSGFYGGGAEYNYKGGGGGSGYIGNSLLEEKYMYCYNCTTSDEASTKTYTTTNVSEEANRNYAKKRNGYARIINVNDIFEIEVETEEKFGSADVTIDIKVPSDLSEENKYQYYVSTSNTELVGGSWKNYTLGQTFTIAKATGRYYLWIYPISDIEGKIADNKTDINTPYVKQEIAINGSITYDYTGNYEEFIAPITGYYNIELWGAQGSYNSVSKGAYTKGKVLLEENEKVYIYVGASGANATNSVNFNGGKADNGGTNGGGATDIRYFGEYTPTESELLWNSSLGLKSRIMVAGGSGAGSGNNTVSKGAGGTLTGKAGGGTQGGTQTTFGAVQNAAFAASSFGIANGGCSGGNGYYPGGGASCASGAGGGSSFISGYTGCVAITSSTDLTPKAGCTDGTTDIECSYHYSGKIFEETLMIAGDAEMPTHDGTSTMVGNSGDGYAKIEFVGSALGIEVETIENFGSTDVTIDITAPSDLSEENKYQYYVSTSNTELKNGEWLNYIPGEKFTIAKAAGRYYLWIYPISDVEGKIADEKVDINTPYVKQEIVVSAVLKYAYSGREEEFIVPSTGYYKLETWGAQGGSSTNFASAIGGYGAYASGTVYLEEGDILYINVGGKGIDGDNKNTTKDGGYNGGGTKVTPDAAYYSSSGGGATHIATTSGILPNLSAYETDCKNLSETCPILIVSGGGGGGAGISGNYGVGGSGGGITGNKGTNIKNGAGWGSGGSQTAGGCKSDGSLCGSFGLGNSTSTGHGGAGGGGFYGGGSSNSGSIGGGGGGSGYIGNPLLEEKYMYCYNCETSDEISTKTYTTENVSDVATSDYAKSGDGYAKIEYVGNILRVETKSRLGDGETDVTINIISKNELSEENEYKYYLSTSSVALIGGSWQEYTQGEEFTVSGNPGTYYLWIYPIKDIIGTVIDDLTYGTPYMLTEIEIVECSYTFDYTYTGNHQYIDDGDGNFRLKFLDDGTFTLNKPLCSPSIDVFLVGGGGGGRWGGGGGGYTDTVTFGNLEVGKPYSIVIGTGGAVGGDGGVTSAFGSEVNGGKGGYYVGGAGGSGGGGGTPVIADNDRWGIGGDGGYNGGNGAAGSSGTQSGAGGTGQGKTTCEFSEEVSVGVCKYTDNGYSGFYAGGGGGGGYNIYDSKAGGLGGGGNGGNNNYAALVGVANTGGGGGGGSNGYGKVGGSGIVIIRNSEAYNVQTNYCNVTANRNLRAILPSTPEEIIISPKNGSKLPETVTVTGASYTWDSTTGSLVISNPTDNVVITVVGTYDIDTTLEYAYIGASDKLCITRTGTYEVELYGAEGGIGLHGAWCGSEGGVGGKGGYVKFSVNLTEGTTVTLDVGGKGENTSQFGVSAPGGYNGGGNGGAGCGVGGTGGSGGGASSFKISDTVYASANGGGGGGGGCDGSNGKCGGKGGTGGYFLGTQAAGGITRTSSNCTSCPNTGLCNCAGGNGGAGGYGYDDTLVTFIEGASGTQTAYGAIKVTYRG